MIEKEIKAEIIKNNPWYKDCPQIINFLIKMKKRKIISDSLSAQQEAHKEKILKETGFYNISSLPREY